MDTKPDTMRALTVRLPWATLIANEQKTIEVRSWATDYRGDLVICSASGLSPIEARLCAAFGVDASMRGMVQCVARLADVRRFTRADVSAAWLDHVAEHRPETIDAMVNDHFAWVLTDVRPAKTVEPVKGKLNLWTIDRSIVVDAGCLS